MTIVHGGYTFQGQPIGILMLDTKFPRIIGDVGNGFTYDFPVRFYTVTGASPQRVIDENDQSLLQPFIEGARKLEAEGCQAIATSCGFLVMFQEQLAAAVNIPVLTSGLLQVPFLAAMLGPDKRIGILTANSTKLDLHTIPGLFAGREIKMAVQGMQDYPEFYGTFVTGLGDKTSYHLETVESEIIAAAKELQQAYPDLGAYVCEGTNFASFSPAVNRATGLPIFDIVTLIRFVASGLLRGLTSPHRNRL